MSLTKESIVLIVIFQDHLVGQVILIGILYNIRSMIAKMCLILVTS